MKKLLTIMSLAFVGLTFGQEEEPKFNVTGSVDAYFRTNLTSVNDGANVLVFSPILNDFVGFAGDTSAFNNDSGFSAGLANVVFTYEGEKVGFVADFAYGPRMDSQGGTVTMDDGGNLVASDGGFVNEAYMYWNVSDRFMMMMGRFNNWMGYETLSAANNFHYSMSHQFTYSTRNFNGLVAQYQLSDDFRAGVGVMNPAEVSTGNDTGDYSFGAGVTYKETTGISFLSSQDGSYLDFKTAFDVSDNFNVKVNVHNADFGFDFDDLLANSGKTWTTPQVNAVLLGAEGFTSFSAYPQIKSSDKLSWGMRLEYMMFKSGLDAVEDINVFTPTLTARYSVGDLTIIPELRMDSASEDIYTDGDGEVTGGLTSFNLAAVYTF